MKHLKKTNETYFQHFLCALKFSYELFKISIILFIHAIFPFLFENEASNRINEINKQMKKRKNCEKESCKCSCSK